MKTIAAGRKPNRSLAECQISLEMGKQSIESVAKLRTWWKETKSSNKDRQMAGVRSAMTLGYRIARLLYDEL